MKYSWAGFFALLLSGCFALLLQSSSQVGVVSGSSTQRLELRSRNSGEVTIVIDADSGIAMRSGAEANNWYVVTCHGDSIGMRKVQAATLDELEAMLSKAPRKQGWWISPEGIGWLNGEGEFLVVCLHGGCKGGSVVGPDL